MLASQMGLLLLSIILMAIAMVIVHTKISSLINKWEDKRKLERKEIGICSTMWLIVELAVVIGLIFIFMGALSLITGENQFFNKDVSLVTKAPYRYILCGLAVGFMGYAYILTFTFALQYLTSFLIGKLTKASSKKWFYLVLWIVISLISLAIYIICMIQTSILIEQTMYFLF